MLEWADLFVGIPHPSSSNFERMCRFCEAYAGGVDAALPWLAAEVSRNDGHAAMLQVVHRWSGMRLYVPRSHAQFVEKVGGGFGPTTHLQIIERVGVGSQVEVPSAWGVFLVLRRVAISEALRTGLARDEIAYRFGVTMRSLR